MTNVNPLITIYYRLISNVDGTPLTEYREINKGARNVIDFGKINTVVGERAESSYIVEFDIWNNEPAFSAGMLAIVTKDAQNCKFSIWDNTYLDSYSNVRIGSDVTRSLVYARCVTNDDYTEFKPISGNDLLYDTIFGNADTNKAATLSGQPGGDHTIIQTKIVVPSASNIPVGKLNFVANFEYDFAIDIRVPDVLQTVKMLRNISLTATDEILEYAEQEEFIDFTDSERISADIIEATHGISGVINLSNGGLLSGVKISALKNGVVYDYDYTDANGNYRLYLEKGIYDIKITDEAYGTKIVKNYEVKNGIKQHRKTVKSGQIKQKFPIDNKSIKNVTSFESFNDGIENSENLVVGFIIDQHGVPVKDAEIIIVDKSTNKDRKIKVFTKTDDSGKYLFTLEQNVTYDILMRSPKHNVKVVRDYIFRAENGFLLDKIANKDSNYKLSLNSRGEWIYEL